MLELAYRSPLRIGMTIKKQFGSFQEMLAASEVPLLVDFYAPWCGPCQMMASILEQVNQQLKQKVRVVKINTDNYPNLATQYRIAALPTLVLFKNGQAIDRIEGVMPADGLIRHLQNLL
jgi:thioredoxin